MIVHVRAKRLVGMMTLILLSITWGQATPQHTAAENAALTTPTDNIHALALAPTDFEAFFTLIKPTPEENAWAAVPWMSSLWEARQKAAAEGKPLFLWTMSGQPLGFC